MSTENKKEVAVQEKNITEQVLAKIITFKQAGELRYSPENALKAAYLTLQDMKNKDGRPTLDVCKPSTVANALLKMVVCGLSPLKNSVILSSVVILLCCYPEYTRR